MHLTYLLDRCRAEGLRSRPFELADLIDALADAPAIADADRYRLRELAREVADLLLVEDAADWESVKPSDAIVTAGDEKRIDFAEFADIIDELESLDPVDEHGAAWRELATLLRVEAEERDESDGPDLRPRCNAPTLREGWYYEACLFGVRLGRADGLGFVEPCDIYGRKFKAYTRAVPCGPFMLLRTPKGTVKSFTSWSVAMRAVDEKCEESNDDE